MNLKCKIKLWIIRIKWRRTNKHNYTEIGELCPISRIKVGNYTYGTINLHYWNNPNVELIIGNYCSIASDTQFFLSGEHNYHCMSTYPFKARFLKTPEENKVSKGNIIIGDDVWIGYGCIILSGIKIGQGAIIGAGSIVTKNIPPYAIFCGDKIVKYRFTNEIIEKLCRIDFSKLTKEKYLENSFYFSQNINQNNVDEMIKIIEGVNNNGN